MNVPLRSFSVRLCAVPLLALACSGAMAADYRFNSSSSQNFGTIGNWQTWNGTAWATATALPTSLDNVLTPGATASGIGNVNVNTQVANFSVSLTSGWTIRSDYGTRTLTINGNLTKSGSNLVFRNNNGTEFRLVVTGHLNLNGGLLELGNNTKILNQVSIGGTTTIASGATLLVDSPVASFHNITIASGGTLTLQGDDSDSIADDADVTLESTSVANLNFPGADAIGRLSLDGGATFVAAGTWGAAGSGALNISSRFTGTGILNVLQGGTPMPPIPGAWQLTFEDNFNGSNLDGAKWRLGQHWAGIGGAGNVAPENVTVSDGKLKIKSEQRTVSYGGVTRSYATGEVSSFVNFRQQYGYYEARIKYPAVTGLWPAFWLMPDRAQYGWKDGYYQSYVKFDLTGVDPGAISTAELRMKPSSVETGVNNNVVFMKLYDDSWSESTLTWNNKPTADPVWVAQKWNGATVGQDMAVDVKDFVTQQMTGDKKMSFVLADTFMKTRLVKFHSSEAATQDDRPRLVINGVTYYATEDAYVRWGTLANTNYGTSVELAVQDEWADTASTFNGGMEVDILETLGIWGANKTQHAVHWDGYDTQHQSVGWSNITYPATGDGFHTYGVYWQPGLLEFYVDGVNTASWNNSRVMSVAAYLILSLQIGGWDNNNAGAQVHNQVMEVDWVRVWSGAQEFVTMDNTDTSAVTLTGAWTTSTSTGGYYGADYLHDANIDKGTKSIRFTPTVPTAGTYQVLARWTSGTNRATNVPIDITSAGGTDYVQVNQQVDNGRWIPLGSYFFNAGTGGSVLISNTATNGYVIVDAVRFLKQ